MTDSNPENKQNDLLVKILEKLTPKVKQKKQKEVENISANIYKNGRDFIERGWLKKRNYHIDSMLFQVTRKNGTPVTNIKNDLAEFFDSTFKAERALVGTKRDMLDIISFLCYQEREKKWESILNKITVHNRDKEKAMEGIFKIVDILVPHKTRHEYRLEHDNEPERQRYRFLFMNLFQQINHRLIRKEVHPFPILPVFFGAEGIGKTKLTDFLFNLFRPFVAKASFSAITEPEKHYKVMCENIIVICEELVGANKADNESFKSNQTSSVLDVRTFHTQDYLKHLIYSTTVATSNKSTWEVMRAHGKGRRFGNILIREDIDFKLLEDIDILEIIQGIGFCEGDAIEESRFHYINFCEKYQIETQNLDEFEQWASTRELKQHEDYSLNYFVSFDDFYADWKEFWDSKNLNFPRHYTKKFLKNKIKLHLSIDCRPDTDYIVNGMRGMKVDCSKHIFGRHSHLENGEIVPLRPQSKVR